MKPGGELRRTELKRSAPARKRRPVSPASKLQRGKVSLEAQCRVCKIEAGYAVLDPAHVCDRSLGGCDAPTCVVSLCRRCHSLYDLHQLDLLPFVSWEEQAHAVGHLGLLRALERLTNRKWAEVETREAA